MRVVFVQEAIFPDGRQKTFGGRFWIKGDRSRWDYDEPDEQTVIVLGKRVFIYDPFVGEVQEGALDFPLVYTQVIKDPQKIAGYFKVEEKGSCVILTPIESGHINKAMVCFDKDLMVEKIVVLDSMGNKMTIKFQKVRFNMPVTDDIFEINKVVEKYAS